MTMNAHKSIKATRLSRDLTETEITNISGGHGGGQQTCTCPEGSILVACNGGVALCEVL